MRLRKTSIRWLRSRWRISCTLAMGSPRWSEVGNSSDRPGPSSPVAPLLQKCALRCAYQWPWRMRTTLELPDPLFARLKARAASERVTLKQLLRSYVEQGLSAPPERAGLSRSAATLPRLEGAQAMGDHQLSNAALFELLDP
jgi:hypothetical protein